MEHSANLYSAILFIASLTSITVLLLIWHRRSAPGSKAIIVFLAAMAWWSTTYALFWAGFYPSRPFWLDATYLGAVVVIPAFLVFVLQFSNRQGWLTRPLFAFMGIMAGLTVILLWTDPWHGLFFAGKRTASDSSFFFGGPWFWTFITYSYSFFLLAIGLLAKSWFAVQGIYRRQIELILLAAFIPWLANLLSLLDLNPLPGLDLTPLAFTMTGSIIAITLWQYRFMDVVPIARDKLIENLSDAIMVLDNQNRVVDVNPAFTKLASTNAADLIGENVENMLPDWTSFLADLVDNQLVEQETTLPGDSTRYINVRLFGLKDRQQNIQGKLLVLRDITTRKQLEEERENLIDTLQTALGQVKTLRGLLPICANCKKIRDDQGYWQDVAVYVRDHTEAEFSHGICPDCLKGLYPEIYGKSK